MTDVLQARDLTLLRGDRCLFEGLTATLETGGLLLLEGPNGSGKTSLLKALAGIYEPESGQVLWNGEEIRDSRQVYCDAISWMAHRPSFKADLNLVENLHFETALRKTRPDMLESVLERLQLATLRKLPFRLLSAGQQRRVSLARLLLADTRLWLLDEPFTNLDAAGRDLVQKLVSEHLQNGGLCALAAHQAVTIDAPTERVQLQ